MADAALRALERRWRATRSTDDEGAYIRGLHRAGDERVRLLALLGEPVARELLGLKPDRRRTALFEGIEAFGREAVVRALLAMAEHLARGVTRPHADEEVLDGALEAVRAWCACPCPRHAGLASHDHRAGAAFMVAHRHAEDRPWFAALQVVGAACSAIGSADDGSGHLAGAGHFARMVASPSELRAAVLLEVAPWVLSGWSTRPPPSEAELLAAWRAGDMESGAGWIQARLARLGDEAISVMFRGRVDPDMAARLRAHEEAARRRVELVARLGDPVAALALGEPAGGRAMPGEWSDEHMHGLDGARVAIAAARAASDDRPELAALLAAADAFVDRPCDEHRALVRVRWLALEHGDPRAWCARVATRWCTAPAAGLTASAGVPIPADDDAAGWERYHEASRRAIAAYAGSFRRDPRDDRPEELGFSHATVPAARNAVLLAAEIVGVEPLRQALLAELVPLAIRLLEPPPAPPKREGKGKGKVRKKRRP